MAVILKHLFLIIVLMGLVLTGRSQEVIVKDSGIVAPFKGELRYKITWKGDGFKELKTGLPDSMIVLAADEGFSVRYFGGMSDTILQHLTWERKTGRTIMYDAFLATAWESFPDKKDTLKAKFKKETKTEKIMGKTCRQFSLTWNNKEWKEEFWLWELTRFAGIEDSLPLNQVPPIYLAGLKGIPFRYIRTSPEGASTAEIREIVWMKGAVPLPKLDAEIEILPMPTRANLKHPVLEKKKN